LTTQTDNYYYGTGRRKTSVARVRVYNRAGGVTLNGKPLNEAISVDQWLADALQPLAVTELTGKVTVVAKTHGGGLHGQSVAFSHGLSRALIAFDPQLRPVLKSHKLLTRDPRMRESKKYGLKRARKAPQYTKR
jgi:small subunit ribosomal protein S9